MLPKIIINKTFSKITKIQHIEPDGILWGTSGRSIFKKEKNGDWAKFSKFPFTFPKDVFIFSRLAARVLRLNKSNIYVNSAKKVLGIQGSKVYALEPNNPAKFLFQIQGDSVLHGSFSEDLEGWTYFGEYFSNSERKSVTIWRVSPDLNHWEIAQQFPAGQIRHIHGIFQDPFDPKALWVATGDFKNECFLFKTKDRFETVEKFGDGTQQWRAVKLFFTEKYISWITDSNLSQNHACRMRRDTGKIEIGQKIDAPGWYGTQTKEGNFISFTTVEPGAGVFTNNSSIYLSKDAYDWEQVHSFKKDIWKPMKLFKYGVIFCPSGKMSENAIYLSGEGLIGLDGKSIVISLNK